MTKGNQTTCPLLLFPMEAITPPEPLSEEAEFERLEQTAIQKGRAIAAAEKNLETKWDSLAPTLYAIWSILAQRGDNRAAGDHRSSQISWQGWSADYVKKTGVHPKKLQRVIAAYRKNVLDLPPRKSPREALKKQKAEIPVAQAVVHGPKAPDADDLLEQTDPQTSHNVTAGNAKLELQVSAPATPAKDEHDEPAEAESSHNIGVVSAKFELPSSTQVFTSSFEQEDRAAEFTSEEDEDFGWRLPEIENSQPFSLKAGDRSGLLNLILGCSQAAIKAVLTGLPPSAKAEILSFLIKQLVQMFCDPDRGEGHFEAGVIYIPALPNKLRKRTTIA